MNLLDKAKIVLGKDYIRNYCVLGMLLNSKSFDIDILNDSVFIRLRDNSNFTMLSSKSRKDGEALLLRNLTDGDMYFYTVDEWPSITEGKKVKYHSDCVQLYIPETAAIEGDSEGVIPLTEDMAEYIHERYDHKDVMSVDYIRERIRIGPAYGIMDKGILAGWVMTHEEGTMGALTVLPEYRRKGYAQKINATMVKSLRAQGKPCIVHIIKGNTASLALAKKTGMVFSCDVHWIILEQ